MISQALVPRGRGSGAGGPAEDCPWSLGGRSGRTSRAFSGVQSNNYWSSTSCADVPNGAWYVNLYDGYVSNSGKGYTYYVWPVRGG